MCSVCSQWGGPVVAREKESPRAPAYTRDCMRGTGAFSEIQVLCVLRPNEDVIVHSRPTSGRERRMLGVLRTTEVSQENYPFTNKILGVLHGVSPQNPGSFIHSTEVSPQNYPETLV